MRFIKKGPEPPAFTHWKALANEDWQPSYDDLSGDPKKAVKQALIKDQGGICCYCERRLIDNDSHIEHCKPQHLDDVDALDFSNLICSCQQDIKKGEPRHCGNLKGDWFDEQLFISPLTPDCADHFRFSAYGDVKAAQAGNDAANTTIVKLGLDIPKLRALRAKALEPFLDDVLSNDELSNFVNSYLRVDDDSVLPEFVSAVADVFSDWV